MIFKSNLGATKPDGTRDENTALSVWESYKALKRKICDKVLETVNFSDGVDFWYEGNPDLLQETYVKEKVNRDGTRELLETIHVHSTIKVDWINETVGISEISEMNNVFENCGLHNLGATDEQVWGPPNHKATAKSNEIHTK